MNTIIKTVAGIGMIIAGFFGHHTTDQTLAVGAYNPTGAGTYRLQSTLGSTNTSITLTSFKEPVSNIPYTMSYLNSSVEFGTISPQTSVSEFVSFTDITQNSDGTATLTGVVRGLARSYPYTASSTLALPHSGQSTFVLSDSPQVFNQYANINNSQTITGLWTFTQTPIGINPGGQPNSSETVNGVSQLSTTLQAASSTSLGSTGARLVLPGSLSTSTRGNSTSLNVVVTKNDGRIDPSFFDGTGAGNQYTFNSTTTMSSAVIATTTITTANIASTSIATVNANNVNIFGSLTGNGTNLTNIHTVRYTYATTTNIGTKAAGYATSSANFNIPSGVLTASSTVEFKGNFTCDNSGNLDTACNVFLKDSSGATITMIGESTDQASIQRYGFDITISRDPSSTNWDGIGSDINYNVFQGTTVVGGSFINTQSSFNLLTGVTFQVVQNAPGGTTITLLNYSIIVNP